MIWKANFWKDVLERAIKTFVYTLSATLPVGAATLPVTGLPWGFAANVALSATALSILGSIGSNVLVNNGTASLSKAVEPAPPTATEPPPLY